MNTTQRFSFFDILAVAALIVATGLLVPALAAGQGVVASQDMIDKIREEGRARVIVRLRTPGAYRSEQRMSRWAASRQRSDIAAVQRRVRDRLRGTGYAVRREFKSLPYIAMEIDSAGLARLQAAGADVQGVYSDILVKPFLAESVYQIEGDIAHAAGIDGTGSAVVVIDTGAESTHPFLAGKVVHEACFAVNDDGVSGACPNGQPSMIGAGAAAPCNFDPFSCFHGTHVSGIAVGSGPDFTGVAPGADLIPIQVFHPTSDCFPLPTCAGAFMSDVAAALEYVYDIRTQYPIVSVNLSLGGGYFTDVCDADFPLTLAAIDNLRGAGIATVVASGNGGYVDAMTAPACLSSAIAVGAVDELDNIAFFSNSHPLVDLLAPGTNVISSTPGGAYEPQDGTSMATPHVAGAWAILNQANPSATVDEELALLQTYGRPVTDTRFEGGVTRSRIRLGPAAGVENPVPVLGAVSPSTISAWGPDTVLTITGSGLARSSTVFADGIPIPTSFVSDTEIVATIPTSQLLTGATSMDIFVQSPPLGGGTSATATITLLQPSLTVDVTTAGAGEPITVTLTDAPGAFQDALRFADVNSPDTVWVTTTFTPEGQSTATWTVDAPYTEGFYEFRFFPGSRGVRAATSPTVEVLPPVPVLTTVTPSRVAADGPDLSVVVSGSYFRSTSRVLINGVEQPTTFLSTASVSAIVPASAMATTANSLSITAYTPEAGSTQSNAISLEIAHPTLAVSANDVATGDTVTVSVGDGAGNATDWLALVPAGGADTDYVTWAYVPAGAITYDWDVVMPDTPGVYDVRLFENGGFRRLALSEPITVSAGGGGGPGGAPVLDVSATSVAASEIVSVTMTDGPGNPSDWLALAAVGSPDNTYIRWTYIPAGAATMNWDVAMPDTSGDYEVRLFENGGFTRLATSPTITVTDTPAGPVTLDVSATSVSGGTIVTATLDNAPGNSGDWLALAEVGSPATSYLLWTPVPAGATSTSWDVTMPVTPGDYEIRLYAGGGYTQLAVSPTVTVTAAPPTAPTLDVSASLVNAGATVTVTLSDGPGNSSDWLALAEVGSPDNTYLRWTYVGAGATTASWDVVMPDTPGDYEVRLFEDNGFTRLATSPTITVAEEPTATATIDLSATAALVGEIVTVVLSDGPGNNSDWLALAEVGSGDTAYLSWAPIPAGATSLTWDVAMPATPGDYEVRLFEDGGYTRLATSAAINVTDVPAAAATLDVDETLVSTGDTVVVTLTDGPGNSADWLALADVSSPDTTYVLWTYVPAGATSATWNVTMPTTPGDYEVRLFENNGFTRAATSPTITVTDGTTPPTLDVSVTVATTGDIVTVTLTDGPGNGSDWLALASVGSSDFAILEYSYVPAGASSTTWDVSMPLTPGSYEIRLFENGGYFRLATSDAIAVNP